MNIDEIEKYIDSRYLDFNISKASPDMSIQLLLKTLGDLLRNTIRNKNLSENQIYNFTRDMIRGVSHCIKWIYKINNENLKMEIQDNEIRDFIILGLNYGRVANFFVACHSGYADYNISENEKTVKFEVIKKNKDGFSFRQSDSMINKSFSTKRNNLFKTLDPFFKEWKKELKYLESSVEIPWDYFKDTSKLAVITKHINENLYLNLPDNYNLEGYTKNDFVLFYSFLYGNFLFISWFEDISDAIYRNEDNPYGSLCFVGNKIEIVKLFSKYLNISVSSLENIVHDLILLKSDFHSTLSDFPFIEFNDTIYICIRTWSISEPEHILSQILRKKKKNIYDRLTTELERIRMKEIGQFFGKYNLSPIIEKSFQAKENTITPDFLLQNENTLIIIDYKNMLYPSNAKDIRNKINDMQKANEQLRKYKLFFNNSKNLEAFIKMENCSKIILIALFENPMVIAIDEPEDIVYLDLDTFKSKVVEFGGDLKKIIGWLYLLEKEKLKVLVKHIQETAEIGEWKFIYDLMIPSE